MYHGHIELLKVQAPSTSSRADLPLRFESVGEGGRIRHQGEMVALDVAPECLDGDESGQNHFFSGVVVLLLPEEVGYHPLTILLLLS